MIKMIEENYDDFDEINRFKVCGYYDTRFRDVAECEVFSDLSDAESYAHELLSQGNVSIEDYFVGELDIDSDDYWDNFDGDFNCLPTINNWQNDVWKSMGIKTESKKSCKSIKEDTFDNEDWGYGFDSNGDAIDESTVDELYRIAERDILPKTELAKIDEYVTIDEDSFEFYMSSPWVQESFTIIFEMTTDDLDMMSYVLPDAEWIYDYNGYGSRLDNLKFFIDVKNGEVSKVTLADHSVKDIDDGKYDVEKLESYVAELASSAATAIYNGTTNL